jgi:hypothetical protein
MPFYPIRKAWSCLSQKSGPLKGLDAETKGVVMFAAHTNRSESQERTNGQEPQTDPKSVIEGELNRIYRCYGGTAQLPETFRDAVIVLRALADGSPQ